MGAAIGMAAEIWVYDRTICSGLGDRLGAMLTVATLAHIAGVQVEMEWCSLEEGRNYGNIKEHIPTWVGYNYSLTEFEGAFWLPRNVRWVERFSDTTRPKVSYVGNELPAHEALDQAYTTASRTTRLHKTVHPDDFIRAYYIVGAQLAPRVQPERNVVLHVRAPGVNNYAPRAVRELSFFCTRKVLASVLRAGYEVVVVSDDLQHARDVLEPYVDALTFVDGAPFDHMAILLGALGIIQHCTMGYSSYSSVPAMARGIPLINTYKGEDHRYVLFQDVPKEFHTCAQRRRFIKRLSYL